jgi:hypothetical protein
MLFEILIGLADDAWREDPAKDRTAAIMGATFLEHALRQAIEHHLKTDPDDPKHGYLFDSDEAPYKELASRLRLARALGVITKNDFDQMELIRLIRNAFAHSIDRITFSTLEIAAYFDDFDIDYSSEPVSQWLSIMSPTYNTLGAIPSHHACRMTFVYIIFKFYWKLITGPHKNYKELLVEALRAP